MTYETELFLEDCADRLNPQKKMKLRLTITDEAIYVQPHGHETGDGDYPPILIEVNDGECRVVVWPDINDQGNPQIIGMNGARIERRRHGKPEWPKRFIWHRDVGRGEPDIIEFADEDATARDAAGIGWSYKEIMENDPNGKWWIPVLD